LTPEGKVSRYFYGLDYPPRDLRYGLEDASSGRIGSAVTQPLRMLCYAHDPGTRKYRPLTIRPVPAGRPAPAPGPGPTPVRCRRFTPRPLAGEGRGGGGAT